ncbi:MAG: Na/Pi symporter [Phascolarctobacterium faecium]
MGAAVTAVLQSSSATTVMTVGLVNAGLMTLKQAFGIVMGANIGTTITAQLIAFKLTDYVTLILAKGLQCSCLLNAVVGNIWAGTWVWYTDAGHEYDGTICFAPARVSGLC